MREGLDDRRVQGLLFDYKHFYGDYDHYQTAHGWYRREVRVVRTGIGVRSWHSAQGFRIGDKKLHVKLANAEIYHYGWVRPPRRMTRKEFALLSVHAGLEKAREMRPTLDKDFDYGRLWGRARFTGTHPRVMAQRIAEKDWEVKPTGKSRHRQDQIGNLLLSFIENGILGFRLGEYRNYILLRS